VIFIKAVINAWLIAVGRICEDTFSLAVVEVELLIVILRRDDSGFTNRGASLRLELL
jgi:hypothetical protein